jgi:argininosuccinate lyase
VQDQLSYEQLKSVDGRFEPDVKECLDYERAVELKSSKGGTSKSSVREQIAVLKKMLGGDS